MSQAVSVLYAECFFYIRPLIPEERKLRLESRSELSKVPELLWKSVCKARSD